MTRRHIDRVPSGSKPLTMGSAEFGVDLRADALGAVALTYTDTTLRGRRQGFDRMAELLSGAPLVGRGFSLAIRPRDVQMAPHWVLQIASMRRSAQDAELTAASSRTIDNRISAGIRLGF